MFNDQVGMFNAKIAKDAEEEKRMIAAKDRKEGRAKPLGEPRTKRESNAKPRRGAPQKTQRRGRDQRHQATDILFATITRMLLNTGLMAGYI